MTAHNIACQKCLTKAEFYINEDNILDKLEIRSLLYKKQKGTVHFKVVTICPYCDEVYVLDGSL